MISYRLYLIFTTDTDTERCTRVLLNDVSSPRRSHRVMRHQTLEKGIPQLLTSVKKNNRTIVFHLLYYKLKLSVCISVCMYPYVSRNTACTALKQTPKIR